MIKFLQIIFLSYVSSLFACTVIFVSKEASMDGSSYLLHLDDNALGDQRIVYIPEKDHLPGEKKAIYGYDNQNFPRIISDKRSFFYKNSYGNKILPPTVYIDEVEHTYKYFDGNYAIMNEHQLSIAETTGAVKFLTKKPNIDGRRFDSGELSRIALERCTRAKEAIQMMGALVEKYGFFGWDGEILVVADKKEGWVFEVCSTPSTKGAIWVAKKVPEGEIYVTANRFRIGDIQKDDPNIMYSSNLFEVAEKAGYFKGKKTLNWLDFVSIGEYYHPYYALRRIWRMQDRFAPSLKLSPWVKNGILRQYPFSIKPDQKVSLKDLIEIVRDHYEGTQFDMMKNLASGPFSNPTRFLGDYDCVWHTVDAGPGDFNLKLKGAWERPISFYHCGYVQINQIRDWVPDKIGGVVWIGYTEPKTCCLTPFYIGMNKLPDSVQDINTKKFDMSKPFWTFAITSNWIYLNYQIMIKEVEKKQKEIETKFFEEQKMVDQKALAIKNEKELEKYLNDYSISCLENMQEQWKELFQELVSKYAFNFINMPTKVLNVGYPKEWLFSMDSYVNGPTSYQKPNFFTKFFRRIKAKKYKKNKK